MIQKKIPVDDSLTAGGRFRSWARRRTPALAAAGMLLVLAGWAFCWGAKTAQAGGGGENVFLVVNPRSYFSITLANHYCRLRAVPPSNVFYLDWSGQPTATGIKNFREKILRPILEEIDRRKLGAQIDCVAYVSDFPYVVDFGEEAPEGASHVNASITGLTYLFPLALNEKAQYAGLNTNWYMRDPPGEGKEPLPTRGFRFQYAWNPEGEVVEPDKGLHYMLSTMIAYTNGRGNSLDETIHYLRRSAEADATHPTGTIYFLRNGDVRATTREPYFAEAVEQLKQLGVRAEILDGVLPTGKNDVMGVVVGAASFDWKQSGSTILPGAICENLTSFGGILRYDGGQTPLSEFLRFGAAGSSGTVIEPYAIIHKFPHPMIQVHYARGCSLAEAFYQSVYGPYQLLVVGDPLCQPWAKVPIVTLPGVQPGQAVTGNLELRPSVEPVADQTIKHFELFVEGRRIGGCRPGETMQLDTAKIGDGYHELRIVAVVDSPIETQGRLLLPVQVDNRHRKIDWKIESTEPLRIGQRVSIQFEAPESAAIVVFHNGRLIGKIDGPRGSMPIPCAILGQGPVRLQAVGLGAEGPETHVFSTPIDLEIEPPTPLPPLPATRSEPSPGLLLTIGSAEPQTIESTADVNWLQQAGLKPDESFSVEGLFQAEEGLHQFQLQYTGEITVHLDGQPIFTQKEEGFAVYYLPVSLAGGWHRVRIEGTLKEPVRLSAYFGLRGTSPLGAPMFQH